jgi:hypothetical protein
LYATFREVKSYRKHEDNVEAPNSSLTEPSDEEKGLRQVRLDELSIAPLLTTKLLSRQIVLPDVTEYLILDFEALKPRVSTLFNIKSLLISLCPFSEKMQ